MSSGERRKKGRRKALTILKRAAILIGILDLILAINDCRNAGRFFLLLTMSSTFESSPDTVLENYCESNENIRVGSICDGFFRHLGGLPRRNPQSEKKFHPSRSGDKRKIFQQNTSNLKAFLAIQRLPTTMFKELVMPWKSTFEPSRTDANSTFYFQEEDAPLQMQDRNQNHQVPSFHWKQRKLAVSSLSHSEGNEISVNNADQGKGERNIPLLTKSSVTTSFHQQPTHLSSSNKKEVSQNRKKRFVHTLPPPPPEEEDESSESPTTTKLPPPQSPTLVKQEEEQKTTARDPEGLKNLKGSSRVSQKSLNPPIKMGNRVDGNWNNRNDRSNSKGSGSGGWRTGQNQCTSKYSLWGGSGSCKDNIEKEKKQVTPSKMVNFLSQEIHTRWHAIVRTAQILISPNSSSSSGGNSSITEQLSSPEAKRLKMHIELSPFGPDSFSESEMKVKAVQQILFDTPWLVVLQLYSKLSGSFIKLFAVMSIYTWAWGTILALMLLVGTVTGDAITIHIWIIFNILYSLLFFMIDDWITWNINPLRSTVLIWLSILHSLYKPLATWIVLMQWSELKKLAQNPFDVNNPSNNRSTANTMKLSPSSSSLTKDSTIVDINITEIPPPGIKEESNTATALMLAASNLRSASVANQNQPTDEQTDYEDEEYEDYEVDTNTDSEEELIENRESTGGKCHTENNGGKRNLGYFVNH